MRIIDADKLKEAFDQDDWGQYLDSDVRRIIDNAPTVEPRIEYGTDGQPYRLFISGGQVVTDNLQGWRYEERPHGKWIKHEWGYSCSVCGVSNDYAYDNNIHKFTDYFCPNCGAKMDGGES